MNAIQIQNCLNTLITPWDIKNKKTALSWNFPNGIIAIEGLANSEKNNLTLPQIMFGMQLFADPIAFKHKHCEPVTAHLPLLAARVNAAKSQDLSSFFYYIRAALSDRQFLTAEDQTYVQVNHMLENGAYGDLILHSLSAYLEQINPSIPYVPSAESTANLLRAERSHMLMKLYVSEWSSDRNSDNGQPYSTIGLQATPLVIPFPDKLSTFELIRDTSTYTVNRREAA